MCTIFALNSIQCFEDKGTKKQITSKSMRTYIKVSDKLRRRLWEQFPMSKTTIWSALNYITEGGRSEEIRQWALEHGGRIVDEDLRTDCETVHTQDEMIQTFVGNVRVKLDKHTGVVTLQVPGQPDETYRDLPIKAWGNVLARAQEESARLVGSKAS